LGRVEAKTRNRPEAWASKWKLMHVRLTKYTTNAEYRYHTEHRMYRIQSTEYRIQNTEYRIQNTEYRIQNTEYRIQNAECRMQNAE
jgi:hypothetical protein